MTETPAYPRVLRRWLAAAFAAAFLLLQGLSLAHAAEYGAEHSHDGVVCDVALLVEDADAVEPPQPAIATPVERPAAPRAVTPHLAPTLATPPARAPPVRGPPTPSC